MRRFFVDDVPADAKHAAEESGESFGATFAKLKRHGLNEGDDDANTR